MIRFVSFVRSMAAIMALCSSFGSGGVRAFDTTTRPMQVDDIFRHESGVVVDGSPEQFGETIAVVLARAKRVPWSRSTIDVEDRASSDIWLVGPARTPIAITHGSVDGSGWWGPKWSPDGTKIAMVSSRGGQGAHLWMWSRSSNSLRQISDQAISMTSVSPLRWVDNRHLLVITWPPGKAPDFGSGNPLVARMANSTKLVAPQAWAKAEGGFSTTANVIDDSRSGRAGDDDVGGGQLSLIDVESGSVQRVATGIANWTLSPANDLVAATRLIDVPVNLGAISRLENAYPAGTRLQLEVRDFSGKVIASTGSPPTAMAVRAYRWDPSGRSIGVIGSRSATDGHLDLVRLDLSTAGSTPIHLGDVDVTPDSEKAPTFELASDGSVLVYGVERPNGSPALKAGARRDWFLIPSDGTHINLSSHLPSPPTVLIRRPDGNSFVGLADGKLWLFRTDGTSIVQIGPSNIRRIARPGFREIMDDSYGGQASAHILLQVDAPGKGATNRLFDLGSLKEWPISNPNPRAKPIGLFAGSVLFVDPSSGLWLARNEGHHPSLLFAEKGKDTPTIAPPVLRRIDYNGLDGKPLIGWLLLPPDWTPRRKYPLIVWAYLTETYGPKYAPSLISCGGVAYCPQLAASEGFAVLLPSMPSPPRGQIWDPMQSLPNGVMPAIDEAIALGYVDTSRLFVFGHSFGGYSVLGLITQTNRFRAAIASSPLSDLVSLYGTFSPGSRYLARPQDNIFQQALLETGQASLGAPPWEAKDRYDRNSPINFVQQIKTPLMLVHGDLDPVAPIEQSEEMFTALNRRGNRVRFVRYWGEGHGLKSPANIRDFWSRFIAWFDQFGDIRRDKNGAMVFKGDSVDTRDGAPPLNPADYLKFNQIFAPRDAQINGPSK